MAAAEWCSGWRLRVITQRSGKSKVSYVRAESYCRAERGRAHSQSQVVFVLGKAEILKKILARRARVRDDSGRSLYFEIDLERSFDGTLSRQSVNE